MRKATNVARINLVSLGMCIGKFTKSKKFHLQITALDVIAPYAKVIFMHKDDMPNICRINFIRYLYFLQFNFFVFCFLFFENNTWFQMHIQYFLE